MSSSFCFFTKTTNEHLCNSRVIRSAPNQMWLNHCLAAMGLKAIPLTEAEQDLITEERKAAAKDLVLVKVKKSSSGSTEDSESSSPEVEEVEYPSYVYGSKVLARLLKEARDNDFAEHRRGSKTRSMTAGKKRPSDDSAEPEGEADSADKKPLTRSKSGGDSDCALGKEGHQRVKGEKGSRRQRGGSTLIGLFSFSIVERHHSHRRVQEGGQQQLRGGPQEKRSPRGRGGRGRRRARQLRAGRGAPARQPGHVARSLPGKLHQE